MRLTLALTAVTVFAACSRDAPDPEPGSGCCTATIRARVPEGTGTVYLAANLEELGPWAPDGLALEGEGRERMAVVRVPQGYELEYKFTLGSWDHEALDGLGRVPQNHRLPVTDDVEASHELGAFKKDLAEYIADGKGSGVLGRLVYWTGFESKILGPARHVEIWLPPGYEEDPSRRYPVLSARCSLCRSS